MASIKYDWSGLPGEFRSAAAVVLNRIFTDPVGKRGTDNSG